MTMVVVAVSDKRTVVCVVEERKPGDVQAGHLGSKIPPTTEGVNYSAKTESASHPAVLSINMVEVVPHGKQDN